MKIGCCISIKHIELAKKIGYDYVELSAKEIMKFSPTEWITQRNEILKQNMPIIGFNAFADQNTPIIGPLAVQKQWTSYVDTVLERAYQLNLNYIGIGAPAARNIPSNYDYEFATKEMEFFLRTIADKAKKNHITILYEALNPFQCNFGNHTLEIYNTIKRVHHSNLKIVYDVYHAFHSNETYDNIADLFDEIEHIHINSWDKNLNRYYLFAKDERYVKDFCKFLKSKNYNKTISIEAPDSDFNNTGATSLAMLRKAVLFSENDV